MKNYLKTKSMVDMILGSVGMVVLSPVFLAIAVAIKLEDGLRAPVFFSQKRVGVHKSYFQLYKFRSMRLDTPHDIPTHLLDNPEQYITKVGRFLRKSSLDELPQLYNIARGDMAVVGPRPALWNQTDLIAERDKYGANDVKPGLTGWAQINGRDELEIDVKAKLDGEYVRKAGLAMDIRCVFGTIFSVLRGSGVVEGGTGTMEREKKNKKVMIITNHSYMLWQFRRELIQMLMEDAEVYISTPFVGHEKDFADMGCHMIETPVDRRGINVELVADEWCNTLEDVIYFCDNKAGHMAQIKTPDLGGINNTIEAVLYCKQHNFGAYQGGTCNETDRSCQVCVDCAMATQPDQILAKPGMGVDEGYMIVYNEMNRVIALRNAKKK